MMAAWAARKGGGTGRWAGYARGMCGALATAGRGGLRQAIGLFVCVVRTAPERPRLHVPESGLERDRFQFAELVGRVVAGHLEMRLGRTQVLAEGEDVHADAAQVAEHLDEFGLLLAEADHQAGLGRDA